MKKTVADYYYKANRHFKKGHLRRARMIYKFMRVFFACDINYSCKIGKNVQFPHYGLGVVISPDAIIGDDCKISQGVTIGGRSGITKCPVIGNNVLIGANAIIIGDVTVGNNVQIGAGSVVVKSIPDNCVVVGNPARIIKINGEIVANNGL